MGQLENINNNVDKLKIFADAAFALDWTFIIFYIAIGTIIGFCLGYLFIGVGRTEQRLIGQNYASGYRTGYTKGVEEAIKRAEEVVKRHPGFQRSQSRGQQANK